MIRVLLAGMILVGTTPLPGHGGCFGRQRFKAVVVHHAQPLVYYQVGAALREEAIAKRAAELAIQQFAQQLIQGVRQNATTKPASAVQAVVNKSCVRCHNGSRQDIAEAARDFTNFATLSREVKMHAALLALQGSMPPGDGQRASDQDVEALVKEATGR